MSLVSHLRRLESYKSKPILVITTETADYKKSKAKNVGATGWIAKPVDKNRLLAAVEKTVLAVYLMIFFLEICQS